MADVETSKDPLDWFTAAYQDPQEWGAKDPFKAMLNVVGHFKLQKIGEGSSRIVYILDNSRVIKLARDERGIEQNTLESAAGVDPQVDQLVARVLDRADDFSWVVAQKVKPLQTGGSDTARVEKIIGTSWNEVREAMGLKSAGEYESTPKLGQAKQVEKGSAAEVGTGCLQGEDFIQAVKSFMNRYEGMLLGDLGKLSSWGVNDAGCLVLLDYGITKKKFDQLYK